MRYEIKYQLSKGDYFNLSSYLKCINLKESFKSRIVNSIYYDDAEFKLYENSVFGLSQRFKIRGRFYDKESNILNFEKKTRIGDLGYKNIIHNKFFHNKIPLIYNNNISDKITEIPKRIFEKYSPVAYISYKRKYFTYDNLRITIDRNIKSWTIKYNKSFFYLTRPYFFNHCIMELKIGKDSIFNYQLIQRIVSEFNLIECKNSKYDKAIKSLRS